MSFPLFVGKFLPFLALIFFLKGILSFLINFQFFDIYTALSLALINKMKPNLWAYLVYILLGFLRGFEGNYPSFAFSLLYCLFFYGYHLFVKRKLKEETFLTLLLFWGIAIFIIILGEAIYYFKRSVLDYLDYIFWLNFLVKSIMYGLVILGFSILLYKVASIIFKNEE